MDAVRYVWPTCADARYGRALSGDRVVLDSSPRRGNLLVRFTHNRARVRIPYSLANRDLMDLAATVYVADELEARVDAPDHWSREFDLLMPVQTPERWEQATPALRSCLGFVSGDAFRFSWCKYESVMRWARPRRRLACRADAVCLFSGGMDSLLGAWELLSEGKRVLLVGHQADPTTASAQTALANELARRFPDTMTFVQARVSRSRSPSPRYPLPNAIEQTHRPRSFLFLALAVALANAVRARSIFMPENGLIALNSPLQRSRIGSLSTRTAHPIFLSRFLDFVRSAQIFDGEIRNPFLYQSKSEMLQSPAVRDPLLRRLLARSVSCSRSFRYKDRHVLHCGYCVPCIFRRAAMFEAGLDSARDYAFDVFVDLPTLTATKSEDLKALVPFAQSISTANELALERVVLAHGPFAPEIGLEIGPHETEDYSPWTRMLRNWSDRFLAYVRRTASRQTLLELRIASRPQRAART